MNRTIAMVAPLLALGAVGCGKKTASFHHCANDSECAASQVCFPDGCGNLAQGLRVEIIPNAREALYAQDFVVGTLANKQDFTLAGPSTIQGALQQLIDGQVGTAYPRSVSIQALGESTLIPGRVRSFELVAARAYVLPVATGTYSLLANATEEPLPPIQLGSRIIVSLGEAARADVLFPSSTSLSQLNGRLLINGQPPTADRYPLMLVQAFDPNPNTQRPLSQRALVDSKTGQFQLQVAPPASRVVVHASPVNPDAIVPRKNFDVILPTGPPPGVTLELGDFRSPVTVTGTLRTSSGDPVPGATVYLDGEVLGGGKFRTQTALSSSTGSFSLKALGTPGLTATLWAFPPAESACGILSARVAVPFPTNLVPFSCPGKVQVHGKVHLPDGAEAVGIEVTAQPISKTAGYPLPSNLVRGGTDSNGMYTLYLDPAVYRLDFVPGPARPRLSRFVTIDGELADSGFKPVEVESTSLSKGRRLTGTLYFAPTAGTNSSIAAVASVRFFRLSTDVNAPASVLLAETVSDQDGKYSVILPAR
jgi:hypothetical protein